MRKELYDKIFVRMDELKAIRTDLSFGCELKLYHNYMEYDIVLGDDRGYFIGGDNQLWQNNLSGRELIGNKNLTIIGHPPILSDCHQAIINRAGPASWVMKMMRVSSFWENAKPLLKDQDDELGSVLLEILS